MASTTSGTSSSKLLLDSRTILIELPRLRRYARAMVGDRAAADDLVQDTLERAWARLPQWREGSDLRAWLFSIMHNLRVDQLRRPGLTTGPMEDEYFDAPIRETQTDRLEIRDLESALRRLPYEQREVLLLVGLEEMSYQEVAQTLGIPPGTVMSRLSRARERLRMIMETGYMPTLPLRVVR
jgi:RNA polymerase sigma-70 factor (ECF subfamily)